MSLTNKNITGKSCGVFYTVVERANTVNQKGVIYTEECLINMAKRDPDLVYDYETKTLQFRNYCKINF